MGIILTQLNVYPVKSVAGISLSHAWAQTMGLSFDRRFMVANTAGHFITGRTHPIMSEIQVSLESNGIILDHPSMSPLVLKYTDFDMANVSTHVFSDKFSAYSTTVLANAWFSQLLGGEKQLLYIGENTSFRLRKKENTPLSFADGSPLLLLNQASLDALNARSFETHLMRQFRGNLVVSGAEAFEEDRWAKIRVGSVIFSIDAPCSRCIFTTLDLKTGRFRENAEPLTTLARFRTDEKGNVNFGMNLITLREGMLKVGDDIEVLALRKPEEYKEQVREQRQQSAEETFSTISTDAITPTDAKKNLSISIDGAPFMGNNEQVLLLQAEEAGLSLDFGCRVGRCGRCKLRLLEGDVEHPKLPGLSSEEKEKGLILACSCIPKSPLVLSKL